MKSNPKELESRKGSTIMNHSEIKVGIICPLDIEYDLQKDIRVESEWARNGLLAHFKH